MTEQWGSSAASTAAASSESGRSPSAGNGNVQEEGREEERRKKGFGTLFEGRRLMQVKFVPSWQGSKQLCPRIFRVVSIGMLLTKRARELRTENGLFGVSRSTSAPTENGLTHY